MMFRHLLRSRVALASLLTGTILTAPLTTTWAGKHPEPSVYPLPTAWYLDFKHGKPKRIVVAVPGQKVPAAYWYLQYTVTNNTGKEVEFLPDFDLVTQDGKIFRGDNNIPLPVFDAVKKDSGNDLLVSAAQITAPLHQGEDQAKDGVAIWEEPLQRMGAFTIYVGGLNSEFTPAVDDKGAPIKDAEGRPITLRKALELNFVVWGDEIRPEKDDVQVKPERWVMR
jgi:hypothetical protein